MSEATFKIYDDLGEQDFEASEYTMKCMSCDEDLMSLAIVGEGEEAYKFQCNCPFCGSDSWIAEVTGKIAYGPISDKTILADVDMGDVNKVTLEKI